MGTRGSEGQGKQGRKRTRGQVQAQDDAGTRGGREQRELSGSRGETRRTRKLFPLSTSAPGAPLHRTFPNSLTPHPSLSALRYGHLLWREVIRAPCPCRRVGSEATLRVSPSPRHSLVLVFKFLPQSLCAEVEKSFLCGCLFCCFFRAPFSFAKLLALEPNFRCEAIWIVIILPGFLHVILR